MNALQALVKMEELASTASIHILAIVFLVIQDTTVK